MRLTLAALGMLLTAAGCATQSTGIAVTPVSAVVEEETMYWPNKGEVTTVQLGETMVETYRINIRELVVLPKAVRQEAVYRQKTRMAFDLPAGEYLLVGKDQSGGRFYAAPPKRAMVSWQERDGKFGDSDPVNAGIHVAKDGATTVYWQWDGYLPELAPERIAPLIPARKEGPMREAKLRRQLVYTGTSAGTLSLAYREFSENIARPAFSQDLKYDLKSPIVGYQKARFEIIKTDNTSITYRLIEHLPNE